MDNKDSNQTVWMHRLIQVFPWAHMTEGIPHVAAHIQVYVNIQQDVKGFGKLCYKS